MRKVEISTHTRGVEKTARYGWITKDDPGELAMLHKDVLHIDPVYQRDVIAQKVKDITSEWSWIGCGVLVVARRSGTYFVIDGQHRANAAKRRSDITHLPCIVFDTVDVKQEAIGFLDLNTGRKPVSAIGKHKALLAAGDEAAIAVTKTCERLGISIRPYASKARELKCVAWCMRRAADNADVFAQIIDVAATMSDADNIAIPERVLEGLWYINSKIDGGIAEKRLDKRLREKGAKELLEAASRAQAYYAHGGGKVWANEILAHINKGLRIKFCLIGDEQ